jgi:Fe-S oxidoreductase
MGKTKRVVNMEEKKKLHKVDKCSICGMCKTNCPTFSALKTELDSPRGKSVLIREKIQDLIMYKCTLCGSCVVNCPSNIDLDEEIKRAREKLVKERKTTPQVTEMVKNIKQHGNPYGKVEKGKLPKNLYCC